MGVRSLLLKKLSLVLAVGAANGTAWSTAQARSTYQDGRIYSAEALRTTPRGRAVPETRLGPLVESLRQGQVLFVGVDRSATASFSPEVQILTEVRRVWDAATAPPSILIGLTDLPESSQPLLDQWVAGQIDDSAATHGLGWDSAQWLEHSARFEMAKRYQGRLLALAPERAWVGRIRTVGIEGLTVVETALLPPNFQFGDALYRERFMRALVGHVANPTVAANYYAAQCAEDDIGAHRLAEEMRRLPSAFALIVLSEANMRYSGGMVGRFRARLGAPVLTIGQVNLSGLTARERELEMRSHPQYGDRADYLWVSR